MAYTLKPGESPAHGIKRIALEQIDKAVDSLNGSEDRNEAVHDARKRFKKIRALLRLVRDEIGEEVYQAENRCFRDAGRTLSAVRSSQVMIETLDALLDQYDAQLVTSAFQPIREALTAEHEAQIRRVLDDQEAIAHVLGTLSEARERVMTWPIESTGFDAFRKGLKRVYQRGYKAMDAAYADPDAETFHEWRKRVKYLWYHLRVLQTLWPGLLAPLADEAHTLADLLGDEHDLAELKQTLQTLPAVDYSSNSVRLLFPLIWQERNDLQRRAAELGKRLYAEKPSDFVHRVESYWEAARSE